MMEEVIAAKNLESRAREAALIGAGQTPLLQAVLRHGLVGPLLDRASENVLAQAQLDEPLVEDHAADLLGWLLHQEGDRKVLTGPSSGVQILHQPMNAGYGWVRFFRVGVPEDDPMREKIQQRLTWLAEALAASPDERVYGLLGLPIGPALSEPDAILEHLGQTRWATGHWMAAAYVPARGGFAVMGLAHDLLTLPNDGRPVIPEGSPVDKALEEDMDLEILPGLSHPAGFGAHWGGVAFVEGLNHALRNSYRLDVQWDVVPLEEVQKPLRKIQASPFRGVNLGERAEAGVMGVLVPTPSHRVLVAFEPGPNEEHLGISLLDNASAKFMRETFGVVDGPEGALLLPKAGVGKILEAGLPVWNRLLRIGM
jgi:hypothetical protein